MAPNKRGKMRIPGIILTVLMLLSMLPGSFGARKALGAVDFDISSPDVTGWTASNPEADVENDQQTGSGSVSQDIVGNKEIPPAYLRFSSDGSAIAVRIRVNSYDGNNPSRPEFKNFAFFGIDVNGDGAMDFFLGLYNPTGSNGRVGISG